LRFPESRVSGGESETVIRITPTLAIDDGTIEERFVRAAGPGGQNVNKVATAVELRFDVGASSLPDDIKARLIALAGRKVTADGLLHIDSRVHRSQAMNREAARRRLVDLLRRAAVRPARRRPTKPSSAAREARLRSKKHRSSVKRARTEDDPMES
jgi:ribosome-associated protein